MVVKIIKLGLLMLSNLGYWEFFRSKSKLNVYFLPAFTIAAQFLVLFAAGLTNLLAEGAYAIWVKTLPYSTACAAGGYGDSGCLHRKNCVLFFGH